MSILLRAIITGFGLKIGSELARQFSERINGPNADGKKGPAEDDDVGGADLVNDTAESE